MSETVECWVFRADGPTEEITREAVSDHLSEADACIRIELKDPGPKVFGNDQLGLHEQAVEDALSMHRHLKLETSNPPDRKSTPADSTAPP